MNLSETLIAHGRMHTYPPVVHHSAPCPYSASVFRQDPDYDRELEMGNRPGIGAETAP